jgi:hypothetical protein
MVVKAMDEKNQAVSRYIASRIPLTGQEKALKEATKNLRDFVSAQSEILAAGDSHPKWKHDHALSELTYFNTWMLLENSKEASKDEAATAVAPAVQAAPAGAETR